MKIRPNRGLGILLALVLIALAVLSSPGSDEPVTGSPAQMAIFAENAAEFGGNAYEQQLAEEAMAGVIGLMMLNQIARSAEQRVDSAAAYPNAVRGYYDQQGNYEYSGRRGSGSQYSDGSWNHYSGAAGGAVGGTSDGCIYTSFGWSNC